jgi:hypothetical protein
MLCGTKEDSSVEIGVNGMERRLPRLVQPAADASAV